ncbi:DNA-binding MarR family transcriptional regulator [Dyadobacter sp. BE34]|uniref:DNA-binding MarR family transcriptional regulator n=1 Tax=Dyadobacter fermentans TaxID=94254 RepID=A0ABU1QSX8_9BACT|nr:MULTISPECIES: P-loop NTPase fold protein [Dyadobacter]MDR6804268.1 DNA-binding MarR family transcriptional regulator [Dyadobacter fermentans]MDR7042008.1 DNA-binding MarR family transcriptional regulator [Dyadobacter sp. BE242]MDR7196411.1 DNA-binding MarR family transcriptional regulator [Dyadobacter sp. BE34]MDR7213044.1 DNA-binding MarR family transcriptional regulator [Dyadobacter sp. BE31]MDR7261817.1 DNA-binding MarR family transcriptional regulator [Dyadobacter sp. BE32]
MFIRHNDLVISKDDPFATCQLGRKKYADVLTQIVDEPGNGFVLAINNEWGTGKTTFVKMWQQQLQNNGFTTLYFNAWENDFERNPLAAIMSELKVLRKKSNAKTFDSLVKKGAVLTKNVLPALVKGLAKRYIDSEELVEGIVSSTEAAAEILENEIDEYTARKKSLLDFRADLEKFLESTKGDKPVIFIIDELDRCRPNYAVEVLEHMKHFFAVNGIIFVLSIDKVQLGHAVRGVYGSEQLNADEYLRRFIDLEYSIPEPDIEKFVNYLFKYFSFDQFFKSPKKLEYRSAESDRESFQNLAKILFKLKSPTLRQQEKIFAQARIALKMFSYEQFLFPETLLFLIYLRSTDHEFFIKIAGKKLNLQELSDEFFLKIGRGSSDTVVRHMLFLEVQVTNLYNNYISENQYDSSRYRRVEKGEELPLVISKLDQSENQQQYLECIRYLNREPDRSYVSLKHLLDRINLTETLVS